MRQVSSVLVLMYFASTVIGQQKPKKAFDPTHDSYITSSVVNGTIVELDSDKVSVNVVDSHTMKMSTTTIHYVDYLKKNTIMNNDFLPSSHTYIPKQLKVGDVVDFHIIEDNENKKTYAVSLTILSRKLGLVPPATLASRHRFQHHECRNFINSLTDESDVTVDSVATHGYNELTIRQLNLVKLADRLYGKKEQLKNDDNTLKAPSVTTTKDKPPTEKK